MTSKTSHGSSNQENQLTSTCTVNGMRMSISATTNSYANDGSLCDQTARSSFNWTPASGLETEEINKDKTHHARSLHDNKIIAEDLSPMCSSYADQEPENVVSTANADTWNHRSEKPQEHNQSFSLKATVQPVIHDVIQQAYQTGNKQNNQPQQLGPKNAFNEHEQFPNPQNDKHGVYDMPATPSMACSEVTEQSYQETTHHNTLRTNTVDKNIAAFSTNVANVPMFNQLTAPLMDRTDSLYIYQGSSDNRYQAYVDTSTTDSSIYTTPPVSSNTLQSKPIDVLGNESIGNQPAVTGDVITQYYSLACAPAEMPGVREPLRPGTRALTSQQTTRLQENHSDSPANAQNFCSHLIAEVAKEEKRRQLYRELCDLDGINTGDCKLIFILRDNDRLEIRYVELNENKALRICIYLIILMPNIIFCYLL